ncbi:MAG: preprotein translocase subunit SecY [bacterium]
MNEKLTAIFINAMQVPDLRRRIYFLLGMFVLFVFGAHIPVPGANAQAIMQWFQPGQNDLAGENTLFALLDIFSGGALSQFSIFALGVMPYINASIIFNLLVVIIPQLEELQKEGDAGRRQIQQYVRYSTVFLAAFQAIGFLTLFSQNNLVIAAGTGGTYYFSLVLIVATMTAGTFLLMWMGELITEHGIGNGVSLIIFAGIVSRIPLTFAQDISGAQLRGGGGEVLKSMFLFCVLAFIMIYGITFMHLAERRIPIHYARRMVGRRFYEHYTHHLPLKVNMAGVIPIIFAISVLLIPNTITNFFNVNSDNPFVRNFAYFGRWFPNSWFYYALYALLTIIFTYFYTAVTFNPKDIAENLKKNGGYIQGVRPGPRTEAYISRILERTTFIGALYLAAVAVVPSLMFIYWVPNLRTLNLIGGTSILIMVGVALDTVRELDARLTMLRYESSLG